MYINFEKILKNNLPKNIILPRRALIYVGFQCHLQCGFCYYINKCNEPMFSLDFIKKQIDFQLKYGIIDIEITGGEPSEYKQLRDVCLYIKNKSPKSKIAIITNGGLWQSNIWDLIDEVLISYHISKNDPNINKKFFPLGYTFNKVKKTIDIARQNNILVRTNTVLATFNLDGLQYILDDLVQFKPNMINFLPVNIFDLAILMDNYINYKLLRPKIKNAISFLENNISNVFIYVRYMPFCDMEGYEKYIIGNLLHIYDWFDWNREIDGTDFLKYITNNTEHIALHDFGIYGSTSIRLVVELQNDIYYKNNKCLKCKYLLICDGVEKSIKNKQLIESSIIPSIGLPIKNFMLYFGNRSYDYYRNYYK